MPEATHERRADPKEDGEEREWGFPGDVLRLIWVPRRTENRERPFRASPWLVWWWAS
jgi:hypothetical protein